MPSKTFMSLPQEKQDRIVNAAVNEFSRLRFDEVSINEIIKQAKISRGSFYQYFEDKEDLFLFLSKAKQQELFARWRKFLVDADGDIFQAFNVMANWVIENEVSQGERIFDQNMLFFMDNLHSKMWQNNKFSPGGGKNIPHPHPDFLNFFSLELVDTDKLKVHDEGDLRFLMRIMMGMLGQIFQRKMRDADNFSKEVFHSRVNLLLEWLQNGALKELVDD